MVAGVEVYYWRVSRGLAGANFEQKRQLVELLINRVIVSRDTHVTRTSMSGKHTHFCHLPTNYLPSDKQKDDGPSKCCHLNGGLFCCKSIIP